MKMRLVGGCEVDAIEGKRWYKFRSGVRKWIKRKINKRQRRECRIMLKVETGE